MKVFNSKEQKNLRRELRSRMNEPEQLLWSHLRGNNLGCKFRRQVSIGSYVVDFYCPSQKIAIEIDGDTHYEPAAKLYDRNRDEMIRSFGVRILRFTNSDVRQNISDVVEHIQNQLS